MEGNIISLKHYKKSKRLGPLTKLHFTGIIFSICFIFIIWLSMLILFSQTDHMFGLALTFIFLLAPFGIHHFRKAYKIIRFKSIQQHLDYLNDYTMFTSGITGILSLIFLFTPIWFIGMFFLLFCICSSYITYKNMKFIDSDF